MDTTSQRKSLRQQGIPPPLLGLSPKRNTQRGHSRAASFEQGSPTFVQKITSIFESAKKSPSQELVNTSINTSPRRSRRPSFEIPLGQVEATLLAASTSLEEATILIKEPCEQENQDLLSPQTTIKSLESDSDFSEEPLEEPHVATPPSSIAMTPNPLYDCLGASSAEVTMHVQSIRPIKGGLTPFPMKKDLAKFKLETTCTQST